MAPTSSLRSGGTASMQSSISSPDRPGRKLLDTLLRGGRYATAGAIAGPLVELDVRTLYLKDLTFFGCTFQDDAVFENLVAYIERGEIRPLVAKTFSPARYPSGAGGVPGQGLCRQARSDPARIGEAPRSAFTLPRVRRLRRREGPVTAATTRHSQSTDGRKDIGAVGQSAAALRTAMTQPVTPVPLIWAPCSSASRSIRLAVLSAISFPVSAPSS